MLLRNASPTLAAPPRPRRRGGRGGHKPMRNRRHSSSVERLRLAIDCLPVETREAMLSAVLAGERVIAGGYVDAHGGVCPMLAAHRRGSRIDLLAFARSWDRFTRAGGSPRRASERELRILASQLQASIDTASPTDLHRAIAEHLELLAARGHSARTLHEAVDPSGEIVARRLRGTSPRLRGECIHAAEQAPHPSPA